MENEAVLDERFEAVIQEAFRFNPLKKSIMPKVDFALEVEEDLEHHVNKNELKEEMKRMN